MTGQAVGRWLLAGLALAMPVAAQAQVRQCRVPLKVSRPVVEGPTEGQPARRLPIGGYTLAITWTPDYCRGKAGRLKDRIRCGGDNRFGFTLHGLWPDGVGPQWPQYCRPAALVPDRVIRNTLCATPDPQLIQHEYAKHGTCMEGVNPAAYFRQSTALYRELRYPDMARLSRGRQTVGSFTRAFAAANPGMRADMLRLNVSRQGWLEEVWLCLDTALNRTACRPGGPRPTARLRIGRERA